MKKTLVACASALAAFLIIIPASASAAPAPQLVACVGGGQSDGSFQTQEVNTGPLPLLGLALTQHLCAVLNPQAGNQFVTGLVEDLAGTEAPEEIPVPTPEDLEELIDAISEVDPSNPLAALLLVDAICGAAGGQFCTDLVGTLLGSALTAPIPLGQVTLDGESGSCFGGSQSGTGSLSGGGSDRYDLEWTADYEAGGNAIGVISGEAENMSFGDNRGQISSLSGAVGPGCGAGGKALVLVMN